MWAWSCPAPLPESVEIAGLIDEKVGVHVAGGHGKRIACGGEHMTAPTLDLLPQDPIVQFEAHRHSVGVGVPQLDRALNIGEQERADPVGSAVTMRRRYR
jgi:hypothetical protein